MIAYTRTTEFIAEKLCELITAEIPVMVIDSVRSKRVNVEYDKLEAIEYGLEEYERFQSFTIPKTSKLIVIREEDLPTIKVKELVNNIEGIEWQILDSVNHNRNEYAYRNRAGDIKFKIRLLRKERTLKTANC